MKTVGMRSAWAALVISFVCGSALLGFGLYRWRPVAQSLRRARRSITEKSTSPRQADFDVSEMENSENILKPFADYFLAALILAGGVIFWRRRSPKGYRLLDLWGKRWAGGTGLWILLVLHLLVTGYSALVLVGLLASLF